MATVFSRHIFIFLFLKSFFFSLFACFCLQEFVYYGIFSYSFKLSSLKRLSASFYSNELSIMAPNDAVEFYKPTCLSGYLTPLQRKKLRDLRGVQLLNETQDFKKCKSTKTKTKTLLKPKSRVVKKFPSAKACKAVAPRIKCDLTKIIGHNNSFDGKEKRFFKSRSPDHLLKANFSLPLRYTNMRFNCNGDKNTSKSVKIQKTDSANAEIKENFYPTSIASPSGSVGDSKDISPSIGIQSFKEKNVDLNDKLPEGKPAHQDIELLIDFEFPSDEELAEIQRKAREEHEKKLASKLNDSLNRSTENTESQGSPKLYPIFTTPCRITDSEKQCKVKKLSRSFLDTSKGNDQMIIDAGQKEMGVKVCEHCEMPYFIGQKEDEELHSCYHNNLATDLSFRGWKEERVVGEFDDGRVIQVCYMDKSYKLKKVKHIIGIVNRDLGFPDTEVTLGKDMMYFLFISHEKKVCGCLVAENINKACPVISGDKPNDAKTDGKSTCSTSTWYVSSETVPAICGVNRIWVSSEFRRRKVATRLMDCLRRNFIFGHLVDLEKLAFTDPSLVGRDFAASYTGTNNFMVYK